MKAVGQASSLSLEKIGKMPVLPGSHANSPGYRVRVSLGNWEKWTPYSPIGCHIRFTRMNHN